MNSFQESNMSPLSKYYNLHTYCYRVCDKIRARGKTIPQEARQSSTSFNIIQRVWTRRLRWVGIILRAGPANPAYQALKVQFTLKKVGNLLADAPPHQSVEHLAALAQDSAVWRGIVSSIPASN